MNANVQVTLRYRGKEYAYVQQFIATPEEYSLGIDPEGIALYMYHEGNYSCDCNRSLFLKRYCGVDFGEEGELPCGETIELVSIEPVGRFV